MKFLPLLFCRVWSFFPLLLSHHGQFPLSFTSAVFPAQFLYLSQGTHCLGIHWNSLNIISNIWQSLWNVNEMRNQIYLGSRSGTVVSEGCRCLGRALVMGSCNYSHELNGRAGDGVPGISERARMRGRKGGEGLWGRKEE